VTNEGETATWTAHGVGTTHTDGTATYRGALYFQTMPKQWSGLYKVAVLFDYAVDAEGNTHLRLLGMEIVPSLPSATHESTLWT
jgi:hypothetical protein